MALSAVFLIMVNEQIILNSAMLCSLYSFLFFSFIIVAHSLTMGLSLMALNSVASLADIQSGVSGDQNRGKSRVNVGFTFIR